MTDRPVKQINAFTTQATPANGDFLLLQEAVGSLYKKTTLQNLIATIGIVVDLTPVLGGNLDTNSNSIGDSGGEVEFTDNVLISGADARLRLQDDDDANSFFDFDHTSQAQAKINVTNNSGIIQLDINPIVNDGTSTATVRIFRETNTVGLRRVQIFTGDGGATVEGQIGVDGQDSFFQIGGGQFGIGLAAPVGMLHVDQPDTVGAIPVLTLDQADISEEMIEFNTTIGVGNAIEAIAAKVLTTTHFLKVVIPGPLTRYIPLGTIA